VLLFMRFHLSSRFTHEWAPVTCTSYIWNKANPLINKRQAKETLHSNLTFSNPNDLNWLFFIATEDLPL
jgi:hypothetical protein